MKGLLIKTVFAVCMTSCLFGIDNIAIYQSFDSKRTYEIDVMELTLNPEALQYFNLFKDNISEQKEWYSQWIKDNYKEGKLKYHSNFGISEEQYDYLVESISNIKYMIADKAVMNVSANSETYEIEIGGKYSTIGRIIIRKDKVNVTTSYGEYSYGFYQKMPMPNATSGFYYGDYWAHSAAVDPKDGSTVYSFFTLGLLDKETAIINYHIKRQYNGENLTTNYMFFFRII